MFKHRSLLHVPQTLAATTPETSPEDTEKKFWEELIIKHPTYKWAYLRLSEIEAQNDNMAKSLEYLKKAQEIDPN